MALTINDFVKNSLSADTRDCVQPIVKAMSAAGQSEAQIERTLMQYMSTRQLPESAVMDEADAALIRDVIAQNAVAIEYADYISNRPTEWELRGSKNGE